MPITPPPPPRLRPGHDEQPILSGVTLGTLLTVLAGEFVVGLIVILGLLLIGLAPVNTATLVALGILAGMSMVTVRMALRERRATSGGRP